MIITCMTHLTALSHNWNLDHSHKR